MKVFEHIVHVDRKVYKRTFMNEILLSFTYNTIMSKEMSDMVDSKARELGLLALEDNDAPEDFLAYKDGEVLVSIAANGVLVNVPATKYRDFKTTNDVWNHLEVLLTVMNVAPMAWSFYKGNRFVFKVPIAEKDVELVKKIVLSSDLMEHSNDKSTYVEESTDKKRFFSCKYGFEKFKESDALYLKTLIATQNYTLENLCGQVMETNDLMFDCWYWATSEGIKQQMDK